MPGDPDTQYDLDAIKADEVALISRRLSMLMNDWAREVIEVGRPWEDACSFM